MNPKNYMDLGSKNSWFCPKCSCNNFGFNEECVACKIRGRGIVPRPFNLEVKEYFDGDNWRTL